MASVADKSSRRAGDDAGDYFPTRARHQADTGFDDAGLGDPGLGDALRWFAAVLLRNWWLMLAIVALALIVAAGATMLATPRYTASASVQISDQGDRVLGEQFELQADANPGRDTERFLNTQIEILHSRDIALRVARRLNLMGDARFLAAMGASPPAEGVSDAARQERVLGLLQNNMQATLPRNTRIVQISFNSANAALAARIANAFADEFIAANLQRRFDSSIYARDFISTRLEEARQRLEASERDLNAYARQAGLIRARELGEPRQGDTIQGSVTTSSLIQINQAANEAGAARIAAEGRWVAERAAPALASPAVLANPTVQALMTRRAELETQMEAARQRYLGEHPKVEQAEAELEKVKQELALVAGGVRNSIHADYAAALASERRLREQVKLLKGATLAEQDRAVRYNTLAREADTNRSIYDGLLQRYRELNASAGISTSNLAIIDRAYAPLAPSSPDLPFNLAIALAAGLGMAMAAVFLRDQLDDSVAVPDHIEEKLGLPLLGVIPEVRDADLAGALGDAKSPVAEAYGSLRGVLLYATRFGLPRLIQVTSAQPTEGKSTTAYAIASGYARQGRTVLLVDGDLRRPSLHLRAGHDNRRGLSSLLISADPAKSAITPTGEANLDLLPSGPIPPSPTELLTAPRMAALLGELAGAYDVVVVDSPPVLGLADAPALGALVDGIVFVVEAKRARRGALKAALRRLKAVDAVLLGAVLTRFDPAASGYQADYYGHGYYSYQPAEGSPA